MELSEAYTRLGELQRKQARQLEELSAALAAQRAAEGRAMEAEGRLAAEVEAAVARERAAGARRLEALRREKDGQAAALKEQLCRTQERLAHYSSSAGWRQADEMRLKAAKAENRHAAAIGKVQEELRAATRKLEGLESRRDCELADQKAAAEHARVAAANAEGVARALRTELLEAQRRWQAEAAAREVLESKIEQVRAEASAKNETVQALESNGHQLRESLKAEHLNVLNLQSQLEQGKHELALLRKEKERLQADTTRLQTQVDASEDQKTGLTFRHFVEAKDTNRRLSHKVSKIKRQLKKMAAGEAGEAGELARRDSISSMASLASVASSSASVAALEWDGPAWPPEPEHDRERRPPHRLAANSLRRHLPKVANNAAATSAVSMALQSGLAHRRSEPLLLA